MRYFIFVSLIFMLACSSAPKPNALDTADEAAAPENNVPATKPVEDAPEAVEASAKKETPMNAYGPLSEAYKSQNEEAIYRSAVQILSQNSADPKALNAMGLFHYRKGRFLAAKYFFGRALQSLPRSGEVLNNMGLASLAMDEQKDAIRYFKKALDVNPNDGIAAANLGSIYVQEADYVKARIALELAVKKGMRETRTLTNYGIALTAAGQYEEAKKAYEEALKLSSNNQQAMFNLAILDIDHLKQNDAGLDLLNRIKFLGPAQELRNKMNALENRAKAGIK